MRLLFALVLVLVIIGTFFLTPPADKVVFLDVGQGDAVLIQAGTQQVLIDGGQGTTVLQRLGEEMPWFDRTIEVLIATHPDRDHLEGLVHVLERYRVAAVLLPQMPHSTQLQEEWLNKLRVALDNKAIDYRFAWRGQKLQLQNATLTILGPFSAAGKIVARGNKTNNAAILSRLDFHDFSWLLTSDAEAAVETMLVADTSAALLDVDILKAGHHGSKTSTTAQLLAAASPSGVVVSVGADNRYGHPHPDVMKRLEALPVWRTDQAGSVSFRHVNDRWLLSRRGQ